MELPDGICRFDHGLLCRTGNVVWPRQAEPAVTDSRPVAPPATGATEQVTLYVAYDDPGVLLPQASVIPLAGGRQQRAEELLHALMDVYTGKSSQHPLALARMCAMCIWLTLGWR